MKNSILSLFISAFTAVYGQNLQINGIVLDENHHPVEGAQILVNQKQHITYTDSLGTFSFKGLKKGNYHIDISALGYTNTHKDIVLESSIHSFTIRLETQTESLNEVEIHANTALKRQKEATLVTEVVNATYIQKNLQGSLMKSLEDLPGVSTIDIGSGQSKPVIRGLSFNRVAVVENGIKHEAQQWGEDHGLEIDPHSVKQIEIIKGPASLQYGSDAIGGIIIINNQQIPFQNGWSGQLQFNGKTLNDSFGSSTQIAYKSDKWVFENRWSVSQFADYKVPTDSVHIYSYYTQLKENRLRNTAGKDHNLYSQTTYVGIKSTHRLSFSWVKAQNAFFANAHGLEPRNINIALHDQSFRDIQQPYQSVSHLKTIYNGTATLNQHHVEWDMGFQTNIRKEFSAYVNHGYMPVQFPENLGFDSNLERYYHKNTYSFNLKDIIHLYHTTLSIGLNLDYQKNNSNGWSFIIPSFNQLNTGIFVQNRYQSDKNWAINTGLRYDIGRITTQSYTDWFPSKKATTEDWAYLVRAKPIDKSFQNVSWGIGYTYTQPHTNYKINVGKSFRVPIAKELAANGVNYHHFSYEVGNENLHPETAYQLDSAIEWSHKKWALQISPYLNYFTHYIYLNPTYQYDYLYGAGNQVFEYTEAEVWRWGGELHGHIQLYKNVKTDIIVEYVNAKQQTGQKKGFGLPFSPPLNTLLKWEYQPKIGTNKWKPELTLSTQFTAAQNNLVPPEETTPSSWVWNAQLTLPFSFQKFDISSTITLHNIWNTTYFNHTNYYRLIGVPEPGRYVSANINIEIF